MDNVQNIINIYQTLQLTSIRVTSTE